jgi:RNA polymerase sigma factor (sigma-70 family)
MNDIDKMVNDNINIARKFAYDYAKKTPIDYDDLFQTASIGLFIAARDFDPERGFKFSTYAYRIVSNEIISFIKKQMRHANYDDSDFTEVVDERINVAIAAENSVLIQQIKDAISDYEFNMLYMSAVQEKSHSQIAKILGISKSRVCRTLQAVKEELKNGFIDYAWQ